MKSQPADAGRNLARRRFLLGSAAGIAGVALAAPPASAATAAPMSTTDMLGVVAFDSFPGSNDDAKMTAALNHLRSQPFKPTLIFSNRSYSFTKTYPLNIDGLRFHGPLGGFSREFRNNTRINCPKEGLFSVAAGHKDFFIQNLSFMGTGNFIKPGGSTVLSDCNISSCGFQGFNSVYNGKILRCNFSDWYVNGATGTQLTVGGSDSVLFEGMNFMSGHIATGLPYMSFGSLSQTKIGKMYVTPTSGYGLRINAGSDCEGMIFYDLVMTAYGQRATAPPCAGIQIQGGQAITFFGGVMFNVNALGHSPGDITVTGGADHVFDAFQFVGTHEGFTSMNLNKPAIYTTVPIVVRNPRSVGRRPKTLQQSRSGLIRCDDSSWTIVTKAA